jgi:hypothetical protein
VTILRREKTRPKTSFSSSEWVNALRMGGASPLLVMLPPDCGRAALAEDEAGRGVQRRE